MIRLLSALSTESDSEVVSRLIAETWVELANCHAAVWIEPAAPDRLRLTMTLRKSDGAAIVESRIVEESCSALFHDEQLQEIVSAVAGMPPVQVLSRWYAIRFRGIPGVFLYVPPGSTDADNEESQSEDAASMRLRWDAENHEFLVRLTLSLLQSGRRTDSLLIPDARHMESVAEFAAGAGHEINNPLASIIGQTQLLLRNRTSVETRQALETIGSQAWRIRDMIGDAMLFARPPVRNIAVMDLVKTVRSVTESIGGEFSASGIKTELRCALSVLNISADQSQLSVMVSHLIRNACEAVLARKSLNEENFSGQVTVILKTDRRGKTAELTVTDNGGGLNDEKIRQHLFDPFFSGRQAGRGLGFGLCLCRQIVESHHGIIMFHQYSSDRAEFFVAIPLTEQSSEVTGIGWSITECF